MAFDARAKARQALIKVGTKLSVARLHDAKNLLGALALGQWLAEHPPRGTLAVHTDKTDTYRIGFEEKA